MVKLNTNKGTDWPLPPGAGQGETHITSCMPPKIFNLNLIVMKQPDIQIERSSAKNFLNWLGFLKYINFMKGKKSWRIILESVTD